MPKGARLRAPLVGAVAICTALLLAPVAAAKPTCVNTGPNTTQCQSPGNAQIVTSPPAINYYGGFPFWGGGFVLNLGGW